MSKIKELLKNPNLFNIYLEAIKSNGVVGEIDTVHTIFLVACGRLVSNATQTSFNLCINDESGIGKDYITKKTLAVFPQEQYLHQTRISKRALTYWHANEKDWSWNGKILYLEDVEDEIFNCEVFKVMASHGSTAIIVVKGQSIDLAVNGKPVLIVTSASINPKIELLRRFLDLNLDSSNEQTKRIKHIQALEAAGKLQFNIDKTLIEAQRELKRVDVFVPFAETIEKYFPESMITRTNFLRFLDYIKASAALHQYQREIKKGIIIANDKDYDIARIALMKTTTNLRMIPLTRKQQLVLNVMKNLQIENSVAEISNQTQFIAIQNLYLVLDILTERGFLRRNTRFTEKSDRPVSFYSYITVKDSEIPEWKDIKINITT